MTAFFVCKKNKEKEIENMLQNNEKTAEVLGAVKSYAQISLQILAE